MLELFPCFLISSKMGDKLSQLSLTGFELRDVEVTKSLEFEYAFPTISLPDFRWLTVANSPGAADFGLEVNATLIVSARALQCLQTGSLRHCDIESYP